MLYSGLVTPCALRVGGVLAALIAGSVGPSAKSGQCSSDDNYNSNYSNYDYYSNVSNKNTSGDASSANTGIHRLWGNPQRSLILVLSLGAMPHVPPTTEYGTLAGKVDISSRHVLDRYLQYTLVDTLMKRLLMLDPVTKDPCYTGMIKDSNDIKWR